MPTTAREHWIISGNIERFRKLLEAEDDPERRSVIEALLAAEQAKLGLKPES